MRDLIVQAGFFTGSAPYIFLALRLAFAVFLTIVMFFWLQATRGLGPVQIAIGIFFGYLVYRYALIAVKLLAERRAAKVRREMPPVLDIMLMVLDAGVSVDQALRHLALAAPKTAPVSGYVLKRLIADVESGVPYDAALDRMGYRLGVDEGQDCVRAWWHILKAERPWPAPLIRQQYLTKWQRFCGLPTCCLFCGILRRQ